MKSAPAPPDHSDLVARACRHIEEADRIPDLDTLAAEAGLSRFHFQKIFKKTTGLTPKAWAAANRARRMQDELPKARSVTEAIYESGFESSGRFYADSKRLLGMQAKAYRKGGAGESIRFAIGQSFLGGLLVASTDVGVCAILLGDDPQALLEDLQRRFPKAELIGADRDFERIVAQVAGHMERPGESWSLPLDIRGTSFQLRVWKALQEIPTGTTVTYAEIAERLGDPKAVRAVAGACAANKLAVAIPCHRVVRTDGGLSGYRWGVERKRELLDREAKR
ncbi:methylated-DNA--[protein]-cysteine S-methyltransferase [Luteolibacter flavescens]|uniref:Methylated-DNA--[protein]-cysteine S-methyltransferase n=1 Tax=Luteolibacter flavescens TaxID=1859460 RepID=A0ABT3FK12_9BACT|nr:methylated-DNA--[protein]-cysteine S-methyltransferase [Luteolibacter flavescens]MCW1883345.1 methylated-DNA--[protein]-cysteine S-methyltransferase [Luteolibacter flavescens]